MSIINVGYDASGNGNNWTPTNIDQNTSGTGADVLVDVPTPWGTDTGVGGEVRGNYCTLNPLNGSSGFTYLNGNLDLNYAGTPDSHAITTFAVTSGVYYYEGSLTARGSSSQAGVGCVVDGTLQWYNKDAIASGRLEYRETGDIIYNGSLTSGYATYTTGDVIGVWIDATNGSVKFYKNNTLIYTKTGMTFGAYTPAYYGNGGTNRTSSGTFNFGQRPFTYTAPSGAACLCTTNLPNPAIADGSTAMNVKTYDGNGGTQTVSGYGFQPDLIWIKSRSNVTDHIWMDVLRGNYGLASNDTGAEYNNDAYWAGFTSDGFTVEGGGGFSNGSGRTYVAWGWDAGGTGVSNTAGSITSTVSANTTAGFSIVTFNTSYATSGTVGHGLSSAPSLIFAKARSAVSDWTVYSSAIGAANKLVLNSTAASASSGAWASTAPTSTVFTTALGAGANQDYVAYCFAPVEGYSAFGSYVGNGSADGPFVYTGFRPAFVLTKRTDSTGSWKIIDYARSGYNLAQRILYPEGNYAEVDSSSEGIDLISNGFKIRNSGSSNTSSATYIYMAFAENPFRYSLAR